MTNTISDSKYFIKPVSKNLASLFSVSSKTETLMPHKLAGFLSQFIFDQLNLKKILKLVKKISFTDMALSHY